MSISLGLQSFFENSNQNGFGFIVVTVLMYLALFFSLQFLHHKKRFYLLYGLYSFNNGFSISKYIENVFFSDFYTTSEGLTTIQLTHYPAQFFGTLLFTYFILEIMELKKTFPKYVKRVGYCFAIVAVPYFLFWLLHFSGINYFLIRYLHAYVFIPMSLVLFLLVFYMVMKQKAEIKYYILSGMSVLMLSYLAITVSSVQDIEVYKKTLYLYHIGILTESVLFALAIGLQQKLVYEEKAMVQRKYILQLEENQSIKESINRTLQDELLQSREEIENITAKAQLERTEKLVMKFENRFAQLRLDALRSQMNPHFIFNALNSIKSYFIENNREKAIYYLTKFSKLIRTILENSREDQISLTEELDTLKIYVAIESDRFDNNIAFEVAVDESIKADSVMVPALFLQPFVENSIWHGLSTKKGEKKISIRVVPFNEKAALQICIEDNGVGRKESELKKMESPFKKQSIGLSLTADRMDLFTKKTGKPYTYEIVDLYEERTGKAMGTRVVIELPEVFSK